MKNNNAMTRLPRITAALGLMIGLLGCSEYNPPPIPVLELPPSGVHPTGEPLALTFSEAIDPNSLSIRVWPITAEHFTIENELVAGAEPAIDTCKVGSDGCEHASLTVAKDGKEASLQITGGLADQSMVPLRLEILEGLKDLDGNTTGTNHFFDFQFNPCSNTNTDPITFDDGYYLLMAEVTEPLPVILTLYNEIRVLSDGSFRWIGVDASILDGFAKNTTNPDEIILNTTDNSFALFATGLMSGGSDERCLASEPFDVLIRIDALEIILAGVRLNGAVLKEEVSGNDRIEGTISFESLTLKTGADPFVYNEGSASFVANPIPADKLPDGLPSLCTTLCGDVPAQCDPPANFASAEFCPEG